MAHIFANIMQPFIGKKLEVKAPGRVPGGGILTHMDVDEQKHTVYLFFSVSSAFGSTNAWSADSQYINVDIATHPKYWTEATFNGQTLIQIFQSPNRHVTEKSTSVNNDDVKRLQVLSDALVSADSDCHVISKDGHRIPANKALLSIRSPVFAAMFRTDMSEQRTNEVVVSEYTAESLTVFLRLLCGKNDGLKAEFLGDLIEFFDAYQVGKLVDSIGPQRLVGMLSVSNAAELFFKAAGYNQVEALELISEFIAKNKHAVMETDSWKELVEGGFNGAGAKAIMKLL